MPSTCCCVPGCSNRGGAHLFPKNEQLKSESLNAIKRSSSDKETKNGHQTKAACFVMNIS